MPCNCGGSKQWTPPTAQTASAAQQPEPKFQSRRVWNAPQPKKG